MSEIELLQRHLLDEDHAATRLLRAAGEHMQRANEIQRELDRLKETTITYPQEALAC